MRNNKSTSHVAITFSYRRGRTRIHKATINELGHPPYIRMLFNPENNSLAVQGFEKKVRDAIRVPDNLFEPNGTFEISSTLFLESLRKRMGWDKNMSYLVLGHYNSDAKLVIFELNEREVLTDSE